MGKISSVISGRSVQIDKLHFGCFDKPVDGWLNTDITPHIWLARIPFLPALSFLAGRISKERFDQHRQGIFRKVKYQDVRKRFPFRDNSFRYAYCSHLLEHLYKSEASYCLQEVYRVLIPGAVLRIAVPDLDLAIKEYDPSKAEQLVERIFESRQPREKNRHHWMYNFISLGELLRVAGFLQIVRCEFQKGSCPDLDKLDNRPNSLFVEAVKEPHSVPLESHL